MDDWQRRVIKKNLPKLITDTQCNTTLLAILLAKDVISNEEKIQIDVTPNPLHKADYLYKILITRNNSYDEFLKACVEVKQSGVVHILEIGEWEIKLSDALRECHIHDLSCRIRDNISVISFPSISKAIANYTEIKTFKAAFEGYSFFGFRSQPKNKLLELRGPNNETFLHVAAAYGNVDIIEYLIELRLNISANDKYGQNPGHYIGQFSTNIIETSRILTQHGLNVRHVDNRGCTIAGTVVRHGKINKYHYHHWVEYMSKNGYGDVFSQKSNIGATSLHHALETMDLEKDTIELVTKSANFNINQQDHNGWTILHSALMYGRRLKTIKNLISLGANIKIKDKYASGVLHLAVNGGNEEVIQYLISLCFDVNEKDKNGNTPLHFVRDTRPKRYVELTKLLLENGADLYSKNNADNTLAPQMSISEGVSCEYFKIWVTAMIENGHAHLFTIRGQWGRTPLHDSMQRRDLDLETIKLIIESAKLDINQPGDEGDTILHLALGFGRSLGTIKSLVELGADWKRKGLNDGSVLHSAVVGSNKEAFLYFKSLGADINGTDKDSNSPLHYVGWTRSKDYLGMTKFLLENGANLNAKDNFGRTLDLLMSSCDEVSAEEYAVWKEGMIQLGHAAFFKHESS